MNALQYLKVPSWLSLWGKVADFTFGCSHWTLKPEVSIPALQEFTVCLSLKLEAPASSPWTAFMYRHPDVQYAELGLGGKWGRLVVWLFGREWTTRRIDLRLSRWHLLCLTWSHAKDRPVLYVDGNPEDIVAAHDADTSPFNRSSCDKLAPNGSLTLGAEHVLVDGDVRVVPFTGVSGRFSLFRMWGRERSEREVTSLNCTEGELVKWEWDNWNTQTCAPLPDSSLQCMNLSGRNTAICRLLLLQLRDVLPTDIYLHRVSVFELTRFHCLVYVSVIPSMDVAAVKNEVYTDLSVPYNHPSGLMQLLADAANIHTTPVERFSFATIFPPVVVTGTSQVSPSTAFPATTLKAQDISTTKSASTIAGAATTLTTGPANFSDLYFEVKVNASIAGDCDPEQVVPTWVFVHRASRESFVFQIQVMMLLSDTQEIEEQIRRLLLMPYNNGSVSIATEDIEISRILIFKCNAETHQTRKGLFAWPDTSGGKNATQICPKNPCRCATRHCKLGTYWMSPDLNDCPLAVETISDLDHVEVTADNALDVLEMIQDLLRNHSTLNYQELATVLNKLKDVIDVSVVRPNLGQALINIISEILETDCNLVPFTNTILNITETVGDRMVDYEGSFTLVAPVVAISVLDIFINGHPFNSTVAFISLPSALQHSFPKQDLNQNLARVQFQFYGIPMLFKSSPKEQTLNTFVVSANVINASSPIKDLIEDVQVTLRHLIPNTLYKEVQCVYWNFNKNNGHGGWDDYGCRKYNSSPDYTTCLCDHLTHFGVLLDVSRTQLDPANEQILTIITYAGCGVSSLFLGITVLTYTAFEKLRRDYPSQILINLSLALLGLNLVFLVNSWLSSWAVYGLCVAVASTLHYFLLASFTWMGLEAVNMYFALVKVFNVYVPSYILKFCALGWGLPLVICILVLIVNREAYGSHLYTDPQSTLEPLDNSDNFCWLQDDVTFYVSVVAYAGLVLLVNIGVFVVVLIQIRRMRVNSPAGTRSGLMHDLKGVASLTLLLGLTWAVGFFTWGPARTVLLYLFSGLNSLQGLFIFLFHCLMKENVRKQWRIHLCFGPFRLEEHSEWSNSASVGVVTKPRANPPGPSIPSVRSVKSSSTDSTSASSDSSHRDSSCKRPNLGLLVDSMALPQAQRSPSGTGALPSYRATNPTPGWRNHLPNQLEQ
ncbi:adhesion G-protein coupled receptor G4 [Embiotoca jacksoni]|uniref:adhesion G-protein coupled receptor G4 n=1 Tax=Embiotoca jacksoni TaxID=100190 RepID=UPI00370412D5